MKKVLAAMFLLVSCAAHADVAEDFAAGGVALGGNASAWYLNEGLTFPGPNAWSFSLAPSVSWFFLNFVDCTLTPSVGFQQVQPDANNVAAGLSYGAGLSVGRYVLFNPASPYVLHVSVGVQVIWSSGLPGLAGGVPVTDQSLEVTTSPFVSIAFYNFVADRLAIDLSVVPRLDFSELLKDASGGVVVGISSASFQVSLSLGITYILEQERAPVTARPVLR